MKNCPMCDYNEWEKHPSHHRLIQIDDVNGRKVLSNSKGFDVQAYRCGNCGHVVLFWEPDTKQPEPVLTKKEAEDSLRSGVKIKEKTPEELREFAEKQRKRNEDMR